VPLVVKERRDADYASQPPSGVIRYSSQRRSFSDLCCRIGKPVDRRTARGKKYLITPLAVDWHSQHRAYLDDKGTCTHLVGSSSGHHRSQADGGGTEGE